MNVTTATILGIWIFIAAVVMDVNVVVNIDSPAAECVQAEQATE